MSDQQAPGARKQRHVQNIASPASLALAVVFFKCCQAQTNPSAPGMGMGMATDMGMQGGSSSSFAPQYVDSSYFTKNPAPAPGACPNGDSNPTLMDELTQGPYYVNEDLFRSNVTETQVGLPFEIRITVLDSDCNPVPDVFVDIWHCNATGYYSGYLTSSQDGSSGATGRKMLQTGTDPSTTFLRGTVLTDNNGVATFSSIFPGWYSGRAVHVHTMMHMPETSITAADEYEVYENSSYTLHTGQFFFEDSVLDTVYQLSPYSSHTGGLIPIEQDTVYEGDERTIFTITNVDANDLSAGLVGSVVTIVNRTAHYEVTNTDSMNQGEGSMPGGQMGMSMGMSGPMPGGMMMNGGPQNLPPATGRKILRL